MKHILLGFSVIFISTATLAGVETCNKGVNFYNPATYEKRTTEVTCTYEDGTLARKARIDNGDVVWVQRYTERGVLFTQDNQKNGMKHGECKRFYEDTGKLKEVQHYENDRPIGIGKTYQPDGVTLAALKDETSASSIFFTTQGKPTSIQCGKDYPDAFAPYCKGPVQLYSASGEKDRMFVPQGSRFSGTLRDTNDAGGAAGEASYKDGKRDGQVITRDKNGRITKISNYKQGALSGEQVEYYRDSDQIKERYFYDAALQKKTSINAFYQNGKPKLVMQYIKPKTFITTHYYDTGNPASEATFIENGQCNPAGDYCFDKALDGAVTYSKKGASKVHYYDDKGRISKVQRFDAKGKALSTKHYHPDGSEKR